MTALYERLLRPGLFLLPPEAAHKVGMSALRVLGAAGPLLRRCLSVEDPALQVDLGGGGRSLTFSNPVGLAAGFDKNAEALPGLAALGFGFLETGTLTPRPQPGNQPPRLFRFPEHQGLINRLGFNNRGVHEAAVRFKSGLRLPVPVGFNIGKNRGTPLDRADEDYVECLDVLLPWADFFVVNVSSPNTPGLRDLQAADRLGPLLARLRGRAESGAAALGRSRPFLFVKISPDEDMAEAAAEAAVGAGFDGVVAVNTTRSREGLPDAAPREGGLSGRLLRNRATETVRRVYKAARGRLVVIGVGGIFTAEDAYEKVLAGASLVEVYTGFVYRGPGLVRDINRGLAALLRRDGFSRLRDAVGAKA